MRSQSGTDPYHSPTLNDNITTDVGTSEYPESWFVGIPEK